MAVCPLCDNIVRVKVEPDVLVTMAAIPRFVKAVRVVVNDEHGHAPGSICGACLRSALRGALRQVMDGDW